MSNVETAASLDLRSKTITTFILYEAHHALQDAAVGGRIEVVTDAFPAIDPDIAAGAARPANRSSMSWPTARPAGTSSRTNRKDDATRRRYAYLAHTDGLPATLRTSRSRRRVGGSVRWSP